MAMAAQQRATLKAARPLLGQVAVARSMVPSGCVRATLARVPLFRKDLDTDMAAGRQKHAAFEAARQLLEQMAVAQTGIKAGSLSQQHVSVEPKHGAQGRCIVDGCTTCPRQGFEQWHATRRWEALCFKWRVAPLELKSNGVSVARTAVEDGGKR